LYVTLANELDRYSLGALAFVSKANVKRSRYYQQSEFIHCWSRQPMTREEREGLTAALGVVIHDEVKRALEPVMQDLGRLSLKLEHAELTVKELRYVGVWVDRGHYRKGNLCTHGGSLWHANIDDPGTLPGTDPTAWTLCVKSMSKAS